jgi:hypothetical protein
LDATGWKGFRVVSGLLIECKTVGEVLFLGTRHKLGHVAAGAMLDALSMATVMRRMVKYAHGYSPSANIEAQSWQLGAEPGRGAVRSHRRIGGPAKMRRQSNGPRRVGK